MKKSLIFVPAFAILAGVVVLASQVFSGVVVEAPIVPDAPAMASKVAVEANSDGLAVIMKDWQETSRRNVGSKHLN